MQYMFYVFYHFPCNDGELSRIIWEHFEPNSKFYKWKHNETHEEEINIINSLPEHSTVVFLDLTPNIMNKLSTKNNYIIIDHHKNAILTLVDNKKNLPNYNILLYVQKGFQENPDKNNNQSGCVLTWQYFTKEILPSVVYYIGSKDVWDFSNPNTEKYSLGFNEYFKDFNEDDKISFIDKLLNDNNYDDEFINIGDKLIEEYKNEVNNIFSEYSIDNYNIYNNNINIIDIKCSNTTIYKYLIEYAQENKNVFNDADVLRILHKETDTSKTYSLRSLKEHITVDNIARHYGGNGHEKAAGYTIHSHNI